jgi:hypothetical protein
MAPTYFTVLEGLLREFKTPLSLLRYTLKVYFLIQTTNNDRNPSTIYRKIPRPPKVQGGCNMDVPFQIETSEKQREGRRKWKSIQGLYAFPGMKFHDYSMTFPGR